jgi:hypothetical protein
LVTAEEEILTRLHDGMKLSDVYKSAVNCVKKENPDLVDKLTKNFGFAMGIEFREVSLSIAPNCDAIAKKSKYSYLSNKLTCPLILFEKNSTLPASIAGRVFIPSYPFIKAYPFIKV